MEQMTASPRWQRFLFLHSAAFAAVVVLVPLATAQTSVPDSLRIARLTSLGQLWGVVRYFHPALGFRNGGWDANTATAVESVRASVTSAEYAAAIGTLLATLNDPATALVPIDVPASLPSDLPSTSIRWESSGGDSTLVVSVPRFDDPALVVLQRAVSDIGRAQRLVFDLRGPGRSEVQNATWMFARSGIDSLLPATTVANLPWRRRTHLGFPDQLSNRPSVRSEIAEHWRPPFPAKTVGSAPAVVFLVNTWSDIPLVAFAMHEVGQAGIVVDGDSPMLDATARLYSVALGEGLTAEVRIGESGGLPADTVLTRGPDGDAPFEAALALARRGITTLAAPLLGQFEHQDSLPTAPNPSIGYRVLAAYQWWNAIQYFYPNKDLIGEDWTAVLPSSIASLEATRNSQEYRLALSTMAARVHDAHSGPGLALTRFSGEARVAARIQYIDGEPVVASIANDPQTRASGLAVGDVIMRVDGENVSARRQRLEPYIPFSTPAALDQKAGYHLLRGPPGGAELTVRGAGDTARHLSVERIVRQLDPQHRPYPVVSVFQDNIGYVDLDRLTTSMVDSMFDLLQNTRGIIFDGRGYPRGTNPMIAPRLTNRTAVPVALFETPVVSSPDLSMTTTRRMTQSLRSTSKPRYHGKTVLLIDERAISQAEHTGLYFEAANNTTFVGSPTQGTNGTVTNVVFAGGYWTAFSSQRVSHADGRQLQRVGLQPDIFVRPTVEGMRAGRDEVLERALVFLNGSEHQKPR